MSKYTIGIIILAVIAALGVFYFAGSMLPKPQIITKPSATTTISPVQDDIASWKTYSDAISGYLIKHPREWNLQARDTGTILLTTDPVETIEGQRSGFSITVTENKDKASPKEYFDLILENQKGSVCEGNIKEVSNIPGALKNLDVLIVDGLCGIFFEGPRMHVFKNNLIYILSSTFDEPVTEKDRELVYRIFSTFRFLK